MTDKELRKLSRTELLEMLLGQMKENEQLREELARANERLESKTIIKSNTGTLAEAALKLNGVFEAAQAAADQYLENLRSTEEACDIIRQEAEKEAARIIEDAKEDSKKYWIEMTDRLVNFYHEYNEVGGANKE